MSQYHRSMCVFYQRAKTGKDLKFQGLLSPREKLNVVSYGAES